MSSSRFMLSFAAALLAPLAASAQNAAPAGALHQQLFGAPTVQSTELHLMVEVRDAAQGAAIIAALEAGHYVVRRG